MIKNYEKCPACQCTDFYLAKCQMKEVMTEAGLQKVVGRYYCSHCRVPVRYELKRSLNLKWGFAEEMYSEIQKNKEMA